MMQINKLMAIGLVAASLFGTAGLVAAEENPHEMREKAMKAMGGSMKAIKDIVGADGPAADIVAPAQKIAEIAATIPTLFPEGSDLEDDEASPEIWTHWDDFTAKAKSLESEAGMLAAAAGGGDMATVGAQFEKVGGACGTCHKAYRIKN